MSKRESTKDDRVSWSSHGTAGAAVRVSENRADAVAVCSCTKASLFSPAGEIVVLRIAGEGSVIRIWMLLWTASDLPVQYPSAAAGVIAAVAGQTNNTAPLSASHGRPIAGAREAS